MSPKSRNLNCLRADLWAYRKKLLQRAIVRGNSAAYQERVQLCRTDSILRTYVLGRLKRMPKEQVAGFNVTNISKPFQGGAPSLGKRR